MSDRSSATDALEAATAAGLRYVSDGNPGIRRRRVGTGFGYVDHHGRRIGDRHTLARIRALAIPPAWRDVWICPRADGHIQAVGRDARGRKQYRYHAGWREARDATKYDRLAAFARRLPDLRKRLARDLKRPGLSREKVLALVVRLLESTSIRIGNPEYARANGSFGLTTLRGRHASVSATCVRFRFRGKAGKTHDIDVADRRVARLVRRCQDLPGQELFQYLEDGDSPRAVGSADVNGYLRAACGGDVTAKDFRTWAGTVAAARALDALPPPASRAAARRAVVDAVKVVAAQLGNTVAVCRKCYVHPAVIEAYLRGVTLRALPASPGGRGLTVEERRVLALLDRSAGPSRRRAAS